MNFYKSGLESFLQKIQKIYSSKFFSNYILLAKKPCPFTVDRNFLLCGLINFSVWLFFMDWRLVDEVLIGRGELPLSLDFLESYDFELSLLNDGKDGAPIQDYNGYIVFLAVVRYLSSMPYRQLEGFTRSLHRLIPRLPTIDYSWVRRRMLDLSPYESLRCYDGPVVIAVDL